MDLIVLLLEVFRPPGRSVQPLRISNVRWVIHFFVVGAAIVNTLVSLIVLRPGAPRWAVFALAGTTLAGVVLLSAEVGPGTWVIPVMAPLIITAGVGCLRWVTSRRPGGLVARMVWRQLRKVTLTRPDGRAMLTLSDLRAEYGQSVLDDAARDPELDRILDGYVEQLAARICEPPPGRPRPALNIWSVTAYANGFLEAITDPNRRPSGSRPYRGYSDDMLVFAALCRLADRLDGTDLPLFRPADA